MNKATKEAVAQAETMVKDAQGAFQSAFDKMSATAGEINEFGKANMDAAVKSGELSSKAAEALSKEVADISKKNFDDSVKIAQELASVKTVTELFEKQASFAQKAFDTYSAQMKVIADLATKSAKESLAPINARVEAAGQMAKNFKA